MFLSRVREKFDDNHDEKHCSFRMAVALHDRLIDTYGSIICREIHRKIFSRNFDLGNGEDKVSFEDAGTHRDRCTGVVAYASRWTM
jgi:hypothetical protein